MSKKTIIIISLVSFVLIGALALIFFGSTQFEIFLEGYNIEEDFTVLRTDLWSEELTQFTCQIPGMIKSYGGTTKISNGNYLLSTKNGAKVKVTYNKNLKNENILTKVKISYGHPGEANLGALGSSSFQILLNNKIAFSGSTPLTFGSSSSDFLIGFEKDIINRDLFYVNVNGEPVSQIEVPEDEVILSYIITGASGSCSYPGSGTLSIDYIQTKPYFSCNIDTDEVVVRDVFLEETTFSKQDLNFQPKTFCVDNYPAIVRSFEEKGSVADIRGQITRALASGESITVNKGESIEIYSIVDYQEGMGDRCTLDQAYDPEKKECVKIIEEEPDVLTFLNIQDTIVIEPNQLLFQNSIDVGDYKIKSSNIQYLCSEQKQLASSENSACWKITINEKEINYQEEIDLNQYLKVKWKPVGLRSEDGLISPDYQNEFILTLNNEILQSLLTDTTPNDHWVLFNSERSFEFKVINNLANFQNSGVQVKKTGGLVNTQETYQEDISFSTGENIYSIPINSSIYGGFQYQLIFWYEIDGKKYFDDDILTRSYQVVDEIPINETTKVITEYETITKVSPILIIAVGSAFLVLLFILVIIIYKKLN